MNANPSHPHRRLPVFALAAAMGLSLLIATSGCQTSAPAAAAMAPSSVAEPVTLLEGDVLRITFPGAPNLDTTQQIRRDGMIALQLVGEVKAAGLTPAQLEAEIAKLHATQLVSNQVSVAVMSSTYPVFVTGAVVRPGRIECSRPTTVLEAVMEAGGPDYTRANLKAVVVTRREGTATKSYTLDLQAVLQGQSTEAFYLKPSDIVYVPERFTWF
jgi:polysaccharide export outer membrane protein